MNAYTADEHQALIDAAADPDTVFGVELTVDLGGCDPGTIRDVDAVRRWLVAVVDHIGMTRHGDPRVERFGEGALHGTTGIQFITASSVMIHAVDTNNSAYINIFSCRPFPAARAARFCVAFFGARAYRSHVQPRCAPPVPPEGEGPPQ